MKLALFLALAAAQWQALSVPNKASFRGLSAVDDNVVWVSGTEGTVLLTADGARLGARSKFQGQMTWISAASVPSMPRGPSS